MEITSGTAAVVTGASSGLGAAVAEYLAGQGAKVAILDMNVEQGEAVAASIGGVFCQVDVTEPESVTAALTKARTAHGQERICGNCAG
ncbi:MAG: SDR family NAD(P)-dependent oxidoreductase, partial [Paracoccaceae bacterium]